VKWLRVDRLMGEWSIPKDSPAGRRRLAQCLEQRRAQESPDADWREVERGWCLGEAAFKQELLAQTQERRGAHGGPELRQADEAHAEELVRQELRRRGWPEGSWNVGARGMRRRWRWRGGCAMRAR